MSGRGARLTVATVVAAGTLVAFVLAARTAMSTADVFELAGIAAAITLIGLAAGALLLRACADRSIAVQVSVITALTVTVIAAGAYAAARRMFISEHDLEALGVVLTAAGAMGVASAILLGSRVGRAVNDLGRATRDIGLERKVGGLTKRPAPLEVVALSEELESMERRLLDAAARERVLEASRRELVASVSHDLRTPLAGMRAILEAIEDEMVEDEATKARYLRTLHTEVYRLSALVDDLFELSRADAGVLCLQLERVSLSDLVSDALAGAMPVATAKGVRLVGTRAEDPPEVTVSPPEVLRALHNILENAIRHTPSDGSVIVEVGVDHDEPSRAFVTVQDSGGGVADQDLPRIFDVAFQSDPARGSGGGSGLGLAIAKRFVEAHDGDVVACNQDAGARFTVRLPRSKISA